MDDTLLRLLIGVGVLAGFYAVFVVPLVFSSHVLEEYFPSLNRWFDHLPGPAVLWFLGRVVWIPIVLALLIIAAPFLALYVGYRRFVD